MNALTLAHFAAGLPPRRARLVLAAALHCANEQRDPLAPYRARLAAAWERGLQPLSIALAAALHAESEDALRGFRHLLPGLLREVNRLPATADVLAEAMAHAFFTTWYEETGTSPLRAAAGDEQIGAVLFSEEPTVTAAMEQWRSRTVFETDLSSAELRGFSQQLRNRSVFSARTTNAEYLSKVAETVDEILSGNIGMTEGRIRLMRKLKQLGYDPAEGFPGDMAAIPTAERGSLQDLSSERRIDLLLETNVRMARGYSQMLAGNSETARYAYPAWRLVRLYLRDVPRGSAESKSVGWQTRWWDAFAEVGGVGAMQDELLALKDSPIWQALGDGAGGYTDTLLNPFPPFAFRSGYAWAAVPRAQVIERGLMKDEALPQATAATLDPSEKEWVRILDNMPGDFRAELERELGL